MKKVNRKGVLIWSKTYGGDHYTGDDHGIIVKILSDGDLILVGVSLDYPSNKTKRLIIKLDKDGNALWERQVGNSRSIWPNDISIQANGTYILSGTTSHKTDFFDYDFFMSQVDDNGNQLNFVTLDTKSKEWGGIIRKMPDGGHLTIGSTDGYGAGERDAVILRHDSMGGLIWRKTFGGEAMDEISLAVLTSDGFVALTGYTESRGAGESDVWFLKVPVE